MFYIEPVSADEAFQLILLVIFIFGSPTFALIQTIKTIIKPSAMDTYSEIVCDIIRAIYSFFCTFIWFVQLTNGIFLFVPFVYGIVNISRIIIVEVKRDRFNVFAASGSQRRILAIFIGCVDAIMIISLAFWALQL